MKNIACLKWGPLYGADYVNNLYAMARANCSGDIRFVCLTDDTSGIMDEVECFPCPEMPAPGWQAKPGWRKLTIYRKSEYLNNLSGDWLFLDLDVVITDSLDPFFAYQPESTFVVMENWTQPNRGIGNTSVVRVRIGEHTYLYDNFINDPQTIYQTYDNEQIYISRNISDFNLWPAKWCQLFKVQCLPRWPVRFWETPTIPSDCRIVAFPGDPNPKDAARGIWPLKKPWKRLYKYTRPVTWIDEIYQESSRKIHRSG
jgi:hypothetical protein